jgi:hypothetical protein
MLGGPVAVQATPQSYAEFRCGERSRVNVLGVENQELNLPMPKGRQGF